MSVPPLALVRAVDARREPPRNVSHRSQTRKVHNVVAVRTAMRIADGRGGEVRTSASAAAMVARARYRGAPVPVWAEYDALPGGQHAFRGKALVRALWRRREPVASRVGRAA